MTRKNISGYRLIIIHLFQSPNFLGGGHWLHQFPLPEVTDFCVVVQIALAKKNPLVTTALSLFFPIFLQINFLGGVSSSLVYNKWMKNPRDFYRGKSKICSTSQLGAEITHLRPNQLLKTEFLGRIFQPSQIKVQNLDRKTLAWTPRRIGHLHLHSTDRKTRSAMVHVFHELVKVKHLMQSKAQGLFMQQVRSMSKKPR